MSSPAEVLAGIAARAKRRRIDLGLTQRELAARAGVSYAALRQLETTGKIPLEALVKIAFVLQAEDVLDALFPPRPLTTIDDVLDRPERQRVRKT
jgi:transcriptional regulator with XRE-family HTH domain